MTEVKICGITNREDALAAVHAGADALGFIFYPPSPRFVMPDRAREITQALPGSICRVGVFVDQDPEEVKRIMRFCGLDLIQLHGKESSDYCALFSPSVLIKAVSPGKEEDLAVLGDYPVKAILMDAGSPEKPGGTGMTCDWNLAKKAGEKHRLILAGGLHPGNILLALETVSPQAIDVGSGVEAQPGKKDSGKVRELVAAVKEFNNLRRADPPGSIFRKEGECQYKQDK
jgi:phosphoribosylanthranilate isomerase